MIALRQLIDLTPAAPPAPVVEVAHYDSVVVTWRDGALVRQAEIEDDDDELTLFDVVEVEGDDDGPGARTVLTYPPEMALQVGLQMVARSRALLDRRARQLAVAAERRAA